MTERQFFAGLTGSDSDLTLAIEALKAAGQPFCLIGGLAVNHFVDPLVTLDADFAVAGADGLIEALRSRSFTVARHPRHGVRDPAPGGRAQ
jgi:hypothetical protein